MSDVAIAAYRASRDLADKVVDAVCYAPYTSMEFDPAGNVYTCCENQLYPLGNVAEASLTEIWHGPRARALREALAEGDMALGCNTCHWAITQGNDQPIARGYDLLPVTSAEPSHPGRMTFALSNRCNLECVMCNGELSSRIRARSGQAPLPAAYHDSFFDQLDEFLPHLRAANFLGGEPFLINENFRVWDRMVALGLSTPCAVVTNGTRLDAKVERVLAALPFDIVVSLDGTQRATVEQIRTNIDYDAVVENAARFRDYAADAGTKFAFNYCLTPRNWEELGEFLAFADGWGAEVRVISVTEPGHSLHDLAEAELREVLRSFEAESALREETLTLNRHAWSVEVEQVRRTLTSRETGTSVTIRQPIAVVGPLVDLPEASSDPAVSPDVEYGARERITRWAHGGPVARVVVGLDGCITEIDFEGPSFLGVRAEDAVGGPLDDLLRRTEVASGRDFHAMDRWVDEGVVDQTLLATAEEPVRGAVGSVVRVISTHTAHGRVSFVAADRFYERAHLTGTTVD